MKKDIINVEVADGDRVDSTGTGNTENGLCNQIVTTQNVAYDLQVEERNIWNQHNGLEDTIYSEINDDLRVSCNSYDLQLNPAYGDSNSINITDGDRAWNNQGSRDSGPQEMSETDDYDYI